MTIRFTEASEVYGSRPSGGSGSSVFEALSLPEEAKEALCRDLLSEFGVDRVVHNPTKGELTVRCVMPDHDDRHPSAGLNYRSLVYSCFSCGAGGGLLWLISTVRGHTSPAAARDWLIGHVGLDGEDTGAILRLIDMIVDDAGRSRVRAPIPSFSPRVLEPWAFVHPWLTDPINWDDPSMGGRGVPEQNVLDLEVGYAEAYPLDDKGTTSERIVVPHFWKGKLVGWQSRKIFEDGSPKWLSSIDFPKDETMFHLPEGDTLVVVESPMTVLRHVHHLPLAATFGANITDRQVRLMADYGRVVLWLDPDRAGWRAVEGWTGENGERHLGLIDRLEPYTDVWVVDTDLDVDGADMTDEDAAACVQGAVPGPVWERPKRLRCYVCRKVHTGDCREEE